MALTGALLPINLSKFSFTSKTTAIEIINAMGKEIRTEKFSYNITVEPFY